MGKDTGEPTRRRRKLMVGPRILSTDYTVEDRGHSTPCWIWATKPSPNGYCHCQRGGRGYLAHRLSYEFFVEPIPPGLEIDHLCSQRNCINPGHLEAVTHLVNLSRGRTNLAKTHCNHGHPFDAANTYVTALGRRQCRACNRDRKKVAYHRRRSE